MSAAEEIRSVKDIVSPEEWQLRVDLAATYRLVAMYGWDDMIFTHISVRIPGPSIISQSTPTLFEEITASSLVKIDLRAISSWIALISSILPVLPFTAPFTRRAKMPIASCICTQMTALPFRRKRRADALSQTAMLARANLAYRDYEGVALNLDERERPIADIGDKKLMMLRNHGTLSVVRIAAWRLWVFTSLRVPARRKCAR